jgi:Ca2+-binding EF-hand superfamily protein
MPQIRSAVRQNAAEARDARARIARKKKAREAAQRRRDALATAHTERAAVYEMVAARLMAKYDAEGSGNISADAARAIVNEAVGKEVTDEVLRQLRSMCDCSPPDVTKPMRASDIQFLHQSSRAYGLQAERVTEVLRRYDLDKSGGLDFKELMIAMKEIAPQGSKVRAGDVSWIVEKYDLDGDFQLAFLELAPAVTAWQEVVQLLPPDPEDDDEEEHEDEHHAISIGSSERFGDTILHLASEVDSRKSQSRRSGWADAKAEEEEELAQRAAARCHRLEGARVLKKGVVKTMVRTLSYSTMVVENAELKECERAVHLHEQQKANDAKKAAKDARKSAKNLLAGGDGAAPKKSSMCQVL